MSIRRDEGGRMSEDSISIYLKKATALQLLRRDWDSYGAPPIHLGAIARAKQLLEVLPDWHWQVVPARDGGVQLESHERGYDVEIYISRMETGK
jgi:hypothetical protein